jgi:hypothetical protein
MSFVKVAKVGAIAPGKAIRIEIDDEPIAIFKVEGDDVLIDPEPQ